VISHKLEPPSGPFPEMGITLFSNEAQPSAMSLSANIQHTRLRLVAKRARYASSSFTTRHGSTPVSRWSSPWYLNVNRS
jgi:hypothetical protein